MKDKAVLFDFSGTLVKMRPPQLLIAWSTLEELAKEYRLGIITGGPRSEVYNILRKLQIKDFFPDDAILTKDDIGYRKPDPELIRLLMDRLAVSGVVYIGDTIKDYKMAQAADVPFIYIGKSKIGISQMPNPIDIIFTTINNLFMVIRLATAQDKNQILKLLNEFSAMLGASDIPSQVGGIIFDELMSRNDTQIFVADDNGELIGLTTFYLIPSIRHGWHRGQIEDFFVSNKHRHSGVGTQLLSFIKDYCKEHNIRVIKLASGNELTQAHSFYEKNGGKTTERFFRIDINS